jgi:hypothetical protein
MYQKIIGRMYQKILPPRSRPSRLAVCFGISPGDAKQRTSSNQLRRDRLIGHN